MKIKDKKATVLVYAVTLLFLLCWCPLQVIIFLHTLSDVEVLDIKLWKETLDAGTHVTVYLGFLNSAMNPLLYVFSVQHFWNKVCDIYRRIRYQRRVQR